MKRTLIFVTVTVSLCMTTGCAHKKRVKKLEAELERCYQQKLQLQSQTEQTAAEGQMAQLDDEPQ